MQWSTNHYLKRLRPSVQFPNELHSSDLDIQSGIDGYYPRDDAKSSRFRLHEWEKASLSRPYPQWGLEIEVFTSELDLYGF